MARVSAKRGSRDAVCRQGALLTLLVSFFLLFPSAPVAAQQSAPDALAAVTLALPAPAGARTLPVQQRGGAPYVLAPALSILGWEALPGANRNTLSLRHRTGITLHFTHGSPWVRWDEDLLHMAAPAILSGDPLLPVQLLVDFLPGMLPAAYAWDPAAQVLVVEGAMPPAGTTARPNVRGVTPASGSGAQPQPQPQPQPQAPVVPAASTAASPAPTPAPAPAASAPAPTPAPARAPRVVIIDAGHGGSDPGAVGPGGEREKDIALAVSRALARELSRRPDLEVHLTRDRDALVDLWTRGELATGLREDRPGVFLSIHLNSAGNNSARGFETFFLSEARTEHERRVAAAENAPFLRGDANLPGPSGADPLLSAILRDLVAFDHTHWSALLAEKVQNELGTFHPGPNRGVKQGPFAVLTNTLMPSVLIELGFISNRDEARAMAQPEFQRQAAEAIARAVEAFFGRYPPGGSP